VTLHRFLLPPDSFSAFPVRFPAEVARQISRVLRLKVGEEVIALDGTGVEYVLRLASIGADMHGELVTRRESAAEPAVTVTLYAALLKGSKYETVLQKCTEVGVSRFVPMVSERTITGVPSKDRLDRWRLIVREAVEQSGRARVPEIVPAVGYADAISQATANATAIVLWEGEQRTGLDDLPPVAPGARISLIVGPEGGLSSDEAGAAAARGALSVSLGPRILRAETASIVGSALLLARVGEMRPIDRPVDTLRERSL
jgi:16S rRNA (uracil1498-N3)-methyltransferase